MDGLTSLKRQEITALMIRAEKARKKGDTATACAFIDRVFALADEIQKERETQPPTSRLRGVN